MTQSDQIRKAAHALTGDARLEHYADMPLPGMTLHRFRRDADGASDALHIITDTSGRYEAQLPNGTYRTLFSSGKLDDLLQDKHEVTITVALGILNITAFTDAIRASDFDAITPDLLIGNYLLPDADIGLDNVISNVRIQDLSGSMLPQDSCEARIGVTVTVEIRDQVSFVAGARSAYLACWGDDDWIPSSLGEAVFEVYFASNALPSPDVYGYEFGDWAEVKAEAAPDEDPSPAP